MTPYYSDDAVTLYHGDCRELLPAVCLAPSLLLMDPPYGIAWAGSGYRRPSLANAIQSDMDTSLRDDILALYPTTPALVFGSLRAPMPVGWRHVLAWKRAQFGTGLVGNRLPWLKDWDPIYVLGDWPVQVPAVSGVLSTAEKSATAYSGYVTRAGHPHAKPLDTLQALIEAAPSGTVLDPCTGSGSALVAAKALGRQAIGVEIEERYCEIAAKRLAQDVLDFGGAA